MRVQNKVQDFKGGPAHHLGLCIQAQYENTALVLGHLPLREALFLHRQFFKKTMYVYLSVFY